MPKNKQVQFLKNMPSGFKVSKQEKSVQRLNKIPEGFNVGFPEEQGLQGFPEGSFGKAKDVFFKILTVMDIPDAMKRGAIESLVNDGDFSGAFKQASKIANNPVDFESPEIADVLKENGILENSDISREVLGFIIDVATSIGGSAIIKAAKKIKTPSSMVEYVRRHWLDKAKKETDKVIEGTETVLSRANQAGDIDSVKRMAREASLDDEIIERIDDPTELYEYLNGKSSSNVSSASYQQTVHHPKTGEDVTDLLLGKKSRVPESKVTSSSSSAANTTRGNGRINDLLYDLDDKVAHVSNEVVENKRYLSGAIPIAFAERVKNLNITQKQWEGFRKTTKSMFNTVRGERITIDDLIRIKRETGKRLRSSDFSTGVKNSIDKDLLTDSYHSLNELIIDKLEKLDPGLGKVYKIDNKKISNLIDVSEHIKRTPITDRGTKSFKEHAKRIAVTGALGLGVDTALGGRGVIGATTTAYAIAREGGKYFTKDVVSSGVKKSARKAKQYKKAADIISKGGSIYPKGLETGFKGIFEGAKRAERENYVEQDESEIRSPDSVSQINKIMTDSTAPEDTLAQSLLDVKFKRDSQWVMQNKGLVLSKSAQMMSEEGYRLIEDMVNNNPQNVKDVLPMISGQFPQLFEDDKYNRIDGMIQPQDRMRAVDDLIKNEEITNTERVMKISRINKTGELSD